MKYWEKIALLFFIVVVAFLSCSKSGGTGYNNIKYTLVTDHYEYVDSISYTEVDGKPTNGFTSGPAGSYTWTKEIQITQLPFTATLGAKAVSNATTTSDFTLNIYLNGNLESTQMFHVGSFSTEIGEISILVQ